MKNLMLAFLISLSFFVFADCIEMKTVVNVNPDGSGTVEETLLMSSAIIEMITQFTSSFSEDTTATPEDFSIFNEDELKKRAAEFGTTVKYESGEKLIEEDREGYKAVYSFANINELIIDQNPGNKVSFEELEGEEEPEEKEKENVVFNFQPGSPAAITINMPYSEIEEDSTFAEADSMEQDSASFDQLMNFMQDMKISFLVNLNGKIVETNATYVDGSTVTLMNFSFADLLSNSEKLSDFKKMNPQNLNELKEILKGIPGMQMEFNNPVTIKFK